MKALTLLGICGILAIMGCATLPESKGVSIVTEPPGAAILVDGAYVGDSPVTVEIRSSDCTWVGVMNAPGGRLCSKVRIQAQPRGKIDGPLYTQQVLVDPETMMSNKIFMNLRLEPIRPTQAVEVR